MSHYGHAVRLDAAAARIRRSKRQVLRLVARGVLRRIGPGRRGGTWIETAGLVAIEQRKPSRRMVSRYQRNLRAVALSTLLIVRAARGGKYDSEGLALAEFVQTEFRRRRAAFDRFAHLIYTSPAAQYAREDVPAKQQEGILAQVQAAESVLTCRQLEYLLAVVAVSFAPASKVRDRRDDPEAFLVDAVQGAIKAEHLTPSGKEIGADRAAEDIIRYNMLRVLEPDPKSRLPPFGGEVFPPGVDGLFPVTLEGLRAIKSAVDDARLSAGWRRFLEQMGKELDPSDKSRFDAITRTLGRSPRTVKDIARRVSGRLRGQFAGIGLARIAKVKRRTVKVRPVLRRREVSDGIERCPVCETVLLADSALCPKCGRLVL